MSDGNGGDSRGPQGAGSPDATATVTSGSGKAPVPSGRAHSWGGLRILDELGRGAFGCVYRAWDEALAREVALKIIRIPRNDPALGAAVLGEGRMLARVRHRNVVAVYGAQQIGDEIGLWMELINGRELSQIIRQDGPMGPEEATVVGISLCHALAAVHAAGLVHRDVKAHNVMREAGGRIVLMDFGAGRDLSDLTETREGDTTGTPLYMAPEVLAGRAASPASDIYSLGVLLYFLVTRDYPIEGRTMTEVVMAHGLGRRRLLSDVRPDLPDGFVRVVERALSPSPDRRFKTAGTMMRELAEAEPEMSESWRGRLTDALEQREDPSLRSGASGVRLPSDRFQRAHTNAPPMLVWWTAATGAAVFVIGFLGFATTASMDLTLGRDVGFSDASLAVWLEYGVRTLIPLAVYATATLLVAWVVQSVWRLLQHVLPRFTRFHRATASTLTSLSQRVGLHDTATAAQALFALQVLALLIVCWIFRDLLAALVMLVNTDPAVSYAPLGPANQARFAYRPVLTVIVIAEVVMWRTVLRRARSGRAIDTGTRVGGFAVIGITLLMAAVPYRLLNRADFPRVSYNGVRCYETGAKGNERLLFCPDAAPPRNRIVAADDPALRESAVVESIFTPPTGVGR